MQQDPPRRRLAKLLTEPGIAASRPEGTQESDKSDDAVIELSRADLPRPWLASRTVNRSYPGRDAASRPQHRAAGSHRPMPVCERTFELSSTAVGITIVFLHELPRTHAPSRG